MSVVDRQVARARRRLFLNRLLSDAALGVLFGSVAWVLLLLIERGFVAGVPGYIGPILPVAGAGLAAVAGSLARPTSPLRAALEIDAAAGLKERLSTATALRASSDPFARAAIRDAERAAAGLHVPTHVPLRAPRVWPGSAASAALALALYAWMPALHLLARSNVDADGAAEVAAQTRAVSARLNEELALVRRLAEEHPQLADLAPRLEPPAAPDPRTQTPDDVRREVLKRVDSVREELARRSDAAPAAALRELSRQLGRLASRSGDDAAGRLAQALAQGDLDAARRALAEAQRKLSEAQSGADPAARKDLADLARSLAELASRLDALAQNAPLQKELENRAGLSDDAARQLADRLSTMDADQIRRELSDQLRNANLSSEQLEQLVRKLQEKAAAQRQCRSMSRCLSQSAQGCQSACDDPAAAAAAADALSQLDGQLAALQRAVESLEGLEAAMQALADARESVCRSDGANAGQPTQAASSGVGGTRAGRGIGGRSGEASPAHAVEAIQARSAIRPGRLVSQFLIDGAQLRGEASAELRDAVHAALRDAEDAIDRREVPRQYQNTVATYFEGLSGLLSRMTSAQLDAADPSVRSPSSADAPGGAPATK